MRDLIIFGLFIILLLAAQFTSAKTVDEVIDKYIRARGGKGKLVSVKSIYMEGFKEMMGEEIIVKIMKQQDRLSRTEIGEGAAKGFVLITGEEAWDYSRPGLQAGERVPEEELSGMRTELDIAGPLVDYVTKGHRAELLGKEMLEGNNCYKIKLTTKAGYEMMFWVDTATWLVNQSSANTAWKEAITVYRNYKEVDGIKFAHTCETKFSGAGQVGLGGEIVFSTIIINPSIEQNLFLPDIQS